MPNPVHGFSPRAIRSIRQRKSSLFTSGWTVSTMAKGYLISCLSFRRLKYHPQSGWSNEESMEMGFVANFPREVMKGQLLLSTGGGGGQGVEQFGRSEALVSGLHSQL